MDVQLKKGILEACVLKAVLYEDSYGYKLIRDISPHIEISESTLYPILRRLEADNCIVLYSAEHNGRLRKYYSITDRGKDRLRGFIADFDELMKVFRFVEDGVELFGNRQQQNREGKDSTDE